MAFPDSLRAMKIGELDENQTELLYGVLEALQVDVTLEPSRDLGFLAELWAAEKKKGSKANLKAMERIEELAVPYEFFISHAATSKDGKYGVFVVEEKTDYTVDNGKHHRWSAYRVDKDGIVQVFSDSSHQNSKHSAKIAISDVSGNGISLSVRGGKKIIV